MKSRPPTEPGEGEQQAVLEVQIVSIDYYMAPPTPADCALRTPYNVFEKPLKQVPVVRIFGVTRSEQKICLHVHQVWPYLYVPYSGMQSIEAVRQFGYQLGLSLNHALNVSLKSTELLFVAAVIPVKGVPFYGFCAGYRSFLKVFLANPDMLARASSLLASGAVMGRRHEVFESHLSYTMQFLVDYNLYGVDWVCLDNFLFRSPLPEYAADPRLPLLISDSTVASKRRWVPQGVPSYLVNPTPPDRVSRCELEVDAVAADVANRRQVKERQIHHVFQEDQLEAHFGRLLHSLDSIWIDENQRRAQLGLDPLRPKDSQVRLDMSQIPDCRPATQARAREPKWSNHWRMHSLLQSALADDKRRYLSQLGANQSDMVTDMLGLCSSMACNDDPMESLGADTFSTDAAWLSGWPTCREVDIGYVPLISSDGHGNGRFYSQLLSRLSSVQHAALVAEPNRHVGVYLPESVSNAQQESPLDPVAWPVIVDVGLIDCIEAGTRDSGAYIADTGNESADSSGLPRACYSPSAASASDADDFDDLHGSWIEDELQWTEEERRQSDRVPVSEILHSSRPPCGAASIPQLDGTNDEPQKSARRVAAPLRLAYSASTAAERLVADERRRRRRGASALVLQSTSDHLAKGIGGRSTRSATRDAQRGVSAAGHSTTRKAQLHSELRTLRRHSEVYVDIQHEEGQYLANFIKSQCSAACVADSADRACSIGGSSQDANPSWSDIQQTSRYIAYAFRPEPPIISKLASTLSVYNLVESVAPVPAFLDDQDVPKRAKTYSGLRICSSSRGAHNTPLFDPTYMHGRGCDSPGDGHSRNAHSDMRQEAWEKSAITDLNRSIAKASGLCQQQWHEGWWQFSLPPPRVYSYLSKVHNVGAEAIAATPAQRRQRDQSDLKWSSVLGALSAYPGAASQNTAVVVSDISPRSPELPGATPIPSNNRLPTGRGTKVPMSEMSLEILTSCRETALADPSLDEILCISACFVDYGLQSSKMRAKHRDIVWTCGLSAEPTVRVGFSSRVERRHLADELNMIMALVDWTRENDPDVLCGYEMQQSSWGYVVERAELVYKVYLCNELSRIIEGQPRKHLPSRLGREKSSWGHRKGTTMAVVGRHVLNIWRLMRSELNLTSYTFEKVAKEVLDEQHPHYPPHQLAAWYSNGPAVSRIRALQHVLYRAKAALRILNKTGIVARAAEFASVIGIDFNSVLTRGSQLRVESLMARIAHPELYLLSSPTRAQVAQQRAAECLPLVLEPQSRYYTDPVLVLDFQSLYPSIMIAYNYCFSTCLGSLELTDAKSDAGVRRRLGFTHVHAPTGMLSALKDNVAVSPNGVLFVKPAVRKGLLGRMLNELLESRVMLKDAMKQWGSSDEALFRKLDAWQLGLKLIANVTYGYAGASFSGRMPCVEIADAIVQSGRETLESAIRLIHSKHATWGARVVYGDTDSVFVHLPGKSRQSALRIGQEIADAVTKMNPAPVKLKLEKVYQPCVLLTKKRYAGWMYTAAEQREPLLDVKGMELVRRDGCMATQRILEGTLDSLFRTNDLSLVKSFVTNEIARLLRGDVPFQEYIIAKEVRVGTYSGRTLPAHAKVAADAMESDPRAEPQYGERVPYVVINGGRNARLVDQVVRPHQLLKRPELRINSQYYVDKQVVPALNRVLSLIGVDVRTWVSEMPRRLRGSIHDVALDAHSDSEGEASLGPTVDTYQAALPQSSRRAALRTLDHFYRRRDCFLCGQAVAHVPSSPGSTRSADPGMVRVCGCCSADTPAMLASVGATQREAGQALKGVYDQCVACVGGLRADALLAAQACDCLDCPTMFQRSALSRRYAAWRQASQALEDNSL